MLVLKYHFGGSVTTSSKRNSNNSLESGKSNVRNQFNLIIRSNEYDLLIDYVKNHIVIKTEQINCLHKFRKYVNKSNVTEKDELHKLCSHYNNVHISNNLALQNINVEYIAGLFDSEGCIFISSKKLSKFYISITQKNNPYVLHKIVELLKVGKIDSEQKV